MRDITWNLLMVEPFEGWTSWPSSSRQNITDGNSPGSCCWHWCSSNWVSFKHICINSSICQCLLNPSGNWCWCNWIVRLRKGDNELGAVCSKLGCLFYIYIHSFHWAQGICLIECLKKISLGGPDHVFVRPGMTNLTPSPVDFLNLTSRALISSSTCIAQRKQSYQLLGEFFQC